MCCQAGLAALLCVLPLSCGSLPFQPEGGRTAEGGKDVGNAGWRLSWLRVRCRLRGRFCCWPEGGRTAEAVRTQRKPGGDCLGFEFAAGCVGDFAAGPKEGEPQRRSGRRENRVATVLASSSRHLLWAILLLARRRENRRGGEGRRENRVATVLASSSLHLAWAVLLLARRRENRRGGKDAEKTGWRLSWLRVRCRLRGRFCCWRVGLGFFR
jgi:hypothetical protein